MSSRATHSQIIYLSPTSPQAWLLFSFIYLTRLSSPSPPLLLLPLLQTSLTAVHRYVARLQQKNGPEAMKYFSVITELSSSSTMRILNSKRLQRDSTKLIEHDDMGAARHSAKENKGFFSRLAVADAALIDPLAGRQMIDFFAAGFGFSPIMFDSLICQCYYNAHVMPMLDDMVGFAPNLTSPNSPGGGGGGGAHGDSSATATLYGKIKAAREKSHVAATQITGSMQSTMSAPIRNPERGRGVSLRPLTGGDVGGEEGASGEGSWVPAVDGTASSDVFGKLGERGYLCRAIQVNIPEIFHRKQWYVSGDAACSLSLSLSLSLCLSLCVVSGVLCAGRIWL